jgi:hypothetical protein
MISERKLSVLHSTATLFQEHKLEYSMPFQFVEVSVSQINYSTGHHWFQYQWLKSGTNMRAEALQSRVLEN